MNKLFLLRKISRISVTDFLIGAYFIIDLITLKMYNIADQFFTSFFGVWGFVCMGFVGWRWVKTLIL